MSLRKKSLYIISCLSCIFSLIVAGYIYQYVKYKNILSIQYITKIPKQYIIYPQESELPHFYELFPNKLENSVTPWDGATSTQTINRDGLNERFNYDIQKPSNVYRILTIGDSFTFGSYLDTENNFSEKLEDMLNSHLCKGINKYEVINLGVGGYDVSYTVERFRLRGQKYKPDLIFWWINDHNLQQINELREALATEISKKLTTKEMNEATLSGDFALSTWRAHRSRF